jgi:rhamnosyltransferase subunit B
MQIRSRRIVIVSWGSYGDVFPYMGLALALAKRGHHPVLAVPSYYREAVEREGIEFRPVGPDVDPNDRAMIARLMHPVRGTEAILRGLLMPALRRSYEELQVAAAGADLIVTHPITFAGPVLAQKLKLPWVSTVLSPISFFSATDVPALPPAPRLVHLRRLGPWFGRLVVSLARLSTRSWVEPVYELRKELGLPPGGDPIYEGQFSPTRTLALFSRVLAVPQRDWPPHVDVAGFVFYNGPDTLTPGLEAFLAAGPPPVVFTLGTSAVGAAGSFYQESVDAIARLGLRAVLLTGGFPENHPEGASSPEFFAIDRAPHQFLFPRARAIVHQGGVGTTAQALRSGRPMLVVPHAHDQPDNAYRVENLGVARTVFPAAYRAARVARELKRLLHDDEVRRQAAAIAEAVRAEGGAESAADSIDRVLASGASG